MTPLGVQKHHPIFSTFRRWEGVVPERTDANWLGVMTWVDYANWDPSPQGVIFRPPLPGIDNEEYPEWIDLLSAVAEAGNRFAMAELGAGYGRWLVAGAFAYRQLKPDGAIALVGVEAEPAHFAWLSEHMRRNGIGPREHQLFEAAVTDSPGRVTFEVGEPSSYWGQSIRRSWLSRYRSPLQTREVEAITLAAAFEGVDGMIDLVDLDVQGAEADVLEAGAGELDRVRRVHIGTHSEKPNGAFAPCSRAWDGRASPTTPAIRRSRRPGGAGRTCTRMACRAG
jgi:FkbM family methyltransferase